jgi:hypothetical protein
MFSHFLIFSSRVDPPHDVLLTVRIRQKKEENLFGFIDKLTRTRRRDIVKIMSCI